MKTTPDITYGIHQSPFGWCVIGIAPRGVSHLAFLEKNTEREAVSSIKEKWPDAELTRNDAKTKSFIAKIFSTGKAKQPMSVVLKGTDFQVKVWEALFAIPYGNVSSYAAIAQYIGSPKAVRAVGTACGKNSIAYLVPCHRVLTSDGKLGGYRWGTKRKEKILAWESACAEN